MNSYTPQDAVDRLHKAQCAQGTDVGVMKQMVLDLKAKVERMEKKVQEKTPVYINVNGRGLY